MEDKGKRSLNTNSNTYIIMYATVMVIAVAFILAFVSSYLKPVQDTNVMLDKKKQILAALNILRTRTLRRDMRTWWKLT